MRKEKRDITNVLHVRMSSGFQVTVKVCGGWAPELFTLYQERMSGEGAYKYDSAKFSLHLRRHVFVHKYAYF